MQYASVVQDYLQYIAVERGLSPETLRSYRSHLGKFGVFVGDITAKDALTVAALRKYLYAEHGRGQRPRSLKAAFSALRSLAVWLIEEGVLDADPTAGLKLPKLDAAERRVTSDIEVDALFGAVERIADKRRRAMYRALLSTLANAGLRATEVCDLRLRDVRPDAGMLIVAAGKGSKRRELYPPQEFFDHFGAWMVEREKMGCKHDFVFAQAVHKRVAYEGLRQIMIEITTAAGFEGDKLTAHCLRHNFACHLHKAGATIPQVGAALGHADAQTTFKYLHLNEGDTKAMATLASRRITPPAPVSQVQHDVALVTPAPDRKVQAEPHRLVNGTADRRRGRSLPLTRRSLSRMPA